MRVSVDDTIGRKFSATRHVGRSSAQRIYASGWYDWQGKRALKRRSERRLQYEASVTVIPDKLEPAELPGLVFMLKGRIQRTPFNVILATVGLEPTIPSREAVLKTAVYASFTTSP